MPAFILPAVIDLSMLHLPLELLLIGMTCDSSVPYIAHQGNA